MKRIISVFTASLLFMGSVANAALINVAPNIYRDTATNLEWLKVTETTTEAFALTDPGDSSSAATPAELISATLASSYVVSDGFRIATSAEVKALYAGSGGVYSYAGGGINASLPEVFVLGQPQSSYEDFPFSINLGQFGQKGIHEGLAPGSYLFSGAFVNYQFNAGDYQNYLVTGSSYTHDQVLAAEYSSYLYEEGSCCNVGADEMSVYLVRTVVPIPPAAWLFVSGLLALWRFRRTEN